MPSMKFVLDADRGEPYVQFNRFLGRNETLRRTFVVLHVLPDSDPDNEHIVPLDARV